MGPSHRDLSIQACLLILLAGSLLMGLAGLLIELFPRFPLPPQWRLSFDGSLTVLLIGGGLTALVRDHRPGRLACVAAMVLFGGYNLIHNLLAGPDDGGLSWLTGHPRLATTPALLLLLLAFSCLAGLHSRTCRRMRRLVALLAIGLGLIGVIGHLSPEAGVVRTAVGDDFTLLGGLFAMALGVGLLLIARRSDGPVLDLHRPAVAVGVVGISLSIGIWFLGSWTQHHARVAEADKLVGNLTANMVQIADSRSQLIRRMVTRWQASDGLPAPAVRREEARSYFADVPSLQALAFLDGEAQTRWRRGRDPESLLWLMDQLVSPQTLGWLRRTRARAHDMAWYFPDPDRPQLALVAVGTLDNPRQTMLGVIDLAVLIQRESRLDTGSFRVDFSRDGRPLASLAADSGEEEVASRPFASDTARLPNGPGVTVSALSGPISLASLQGMLPIAVGLLGLLFSYQLIIGRSLVAFRGEQARALRLSEQRFRSLFTQNPDAVFALDTEGTYRSINPVTEAITGAREEELLGRHFHAVITEAVSPPGDVQELEAAFRSASAGRPHAFAMRYRRHDGPQQHLEVSFLPIMVNDRVDGVFGIAKDVSRRVEAEERLRILERSLEASSNAVVISDARQPGFPAIYVNPAFSRITGYLAQEVLGRTPSFLSGPDTDHRDVERIRQALTRGESLSITLRSYRRDGTPFWNQLFLSPVRDADQHVTHFVGIMNDISERKEQENQLAYQATHDVLTGLANRALFGDHLAHDVALARRNGQTLAVLFIDLDEFKPINDTLGHKVGDKLLVSVARRLARGLRPTDTLARFGGDEFVLLLPDLAHADDAQEVAERLLLELTRPHKVAGHELHISASIGIAVNDDDQEDPEKLLQHADMAMYKAKQQGRNAFQVYTGDLDSKLSQRVTLRNELQEAIDRDQLVLHYQPLLDAHGRVDGLEALVRWRHPTKGFISPAEFIPVSEETGQIIPLSRWVMERACRDALGLVHDGLLKGRMAINLSPMQFHRPSFLATLRGVLEETRLPTRHLELELTEGILMKDTDGAIDILNALAGMGISTAIDDFGTGFSSLGYLRTLPIDKIKIDRSFVKDVTASDKDAAICQGVITLARELDLAVVAEGIETREQFEYLRAHGCEVFQGFLFARPMPLEALTEWLRAHRQVQRRS
ncbi:diguanylate cyclase (GGDEF)-like protein/PAS domain S-box-containing protein [Halomonas campaniensis]|uniref:cyclic-guanylate-specific phosphodiesterase n=1 Tax=Halomonas campaniensis TaxID=213554 RepID=A0A7W5K526_9GAMM|nr:EAL domain-containing protein [Halomonas campaniensis]MBB3332099.1 diguanylate cyclase (GGDEF)-like protein/PAS domain S-box-containing protein [Halomonas campaniensis]